MKAIYIHIVIFLTFILLPSLWVVIPLGFLAYRGHVISSVLWAVVIHSYIGSPYTSIIYLEYYLILMVGFIYLLSRYIIHQVRI